MPHGTHERVRSTDLGIIVVLFSDIFTVIKAPDADLAFEMPM
jgi:hypothetical protein